MNKELKKAITKCENQMLFWYTKKKKLEKELKSISVKSTIDYYLDLKAKELEVTYFQLINSRKFECKVTRFGIIFWLRNKTQLTLNGIAKLLGKNHATIISAINQVENWKETKDDNMEIVDKIYKELNDLIYK